jgi:hypothetical protein
VTGFSAPTGSPLLKYCTAAARVADRDREVGRR